MEFNTPPELDGKPTDAEARRLVDYSFPTNFTNDDEKIGKTLNGITWKQANAYFETPQFVEEHRDTFLNILLGFYSTFKKDKEGIDFSQLPASVMERTKSFIDNQNLFHKIVSELYEIGEGKLAFKDIWDAFSQNDDFRKAKNKNQYGKIAFYEYLRGKFQTEGGGHKTEYITNIKKKSVDIQETDEEELGGQI